jgi:glycosyltransferase involved in cell wall biosynthesis
MFFRANLIFIPAWNEEATIGKVITEIKESFPDTDILVIDDGSIDGTRELSEFAGAKVLSLPINIGVGGAVRCALRYAAENKYSKLFQIDADGQHIPSFIHDLLKEIESGADLVIGSRFGKNSDYTISLTRKLVIRILSLLLGKITDTQLSDPTSGFRGFSQTAIRELAPVFPTEYLGDTVEALLLAHHLGMRICEIPVGMRRRQGGEPSASLIKSSGYLLRAVFAVLVAQLRHVVQKRTKS